MNSILKNVAIIGASGSVGKIILDALLCDSGLNVTILTRSSSSTTFPAGTTIHKTDFFNADLIEAFRGKDAVVSVVGLSAFAEQKGFIDAAISAGVKRFIPSEFLSNTLSPAVLEMLPVFAQKKEVLDYLKERVSTGLTWTAISPGSGAHLLLQVIENLLTLEWISRIRYCESDGSYLGRGQNEFTLTDDEQLGRAVLAVLDRPALTAKENIYIASFETSQTDILTALEDATTGKWSVKETTTQKEVAEASGKIGKGDFSGASTLVRATSFANLPGLRGNYVRDEELSNELLGLKFGSVEGTVSRVIRGST